METAIKAARKWAYEVKGVASDRAEIICCTGNFHGRTLAAISMSSEAQYRDGFGPFPEGFRLIEYGNAEALAGAVGPHTAAFLVEPIQGEGGIVVPPEGYLAQCAEICRENDVLLICDEIQTGLGRTGRFLASEHDGVEPDGLVLGKALGGGLLPVSLFLSRSDIMDVFSPGDHGSTFGGNPLAAAVATEALCVIEDEQLASRSAELGRRLREGLRAIDSPLVADVRGRGLFVGMEMATGPISARQICEALMARGLLSKETHETVVRFAPPLVITESEVDWAVGEVASVLAEARG